MVERLDEVDRCFVHMDYEYEHAPEYKRRQPPTQQQLATLQMANMANTPAHGVAVNDSQSPKHKVPLKTI
jgi:hypothetical protein